MNDAKGDQIVRMPCVDCGGWPKNHRVLHEKARHWHDPDHGRMVAETRYQICECLGCNRVSFREVSTSEYDVDENGEDRETVETYPKDPRLEHAAMSKEHLPPGVARIYSETIVAFNAGAMTLAGGGLRAIVEAICIDQEVKGKDLKERIDKLVTKELLARPQADLLHEERFIGNAALHELQPPSNQELRDGIKIVETLLTTIYQLPKHAAKLKKAREDRQS